MFICYMFIFLGKRVFSGMENFFYVRKFRILNDFFPNCRNLLWREYCVKEKVCAYLMQKMARDKGKKIINLM